MSKILIVWGCLLSALTSRTRMGKPLSDVVPVVCNLTLRQSLTEIFGKRAARGEHQSVTVFVFAGDVGCVTPEGDAGVALAMTGKKEAHAATINAPCTSLFVSGYNRLQQDAMKRLINGLHCISTSTPYRITSSLLQRAEWLLCLCVPK